MQNLVESIRTPQTLRFKETVQLPWGSEVRDVIRTKEGRVDRLMTRRGEPLSESQQKKELARLKALLQTTTVKPESLRQQDAELQRRVKMLEVFPKAFVCQELVTKPSGMLRFAFSPAKGFSPKDRETRVYRGVRGVVEIDPDRKRLVLVDGEIFRVVPFGWGIFGRLHRGGRFHLEQREVLPDAWEITDMNLDFTYTILLLSRHHYVQKLANSEFESIDPRTRLTDAVRMLLAEPPNPSRPSE
jgi:hypothetical protein